MAVIKFSRMEGSDFNFSGLRNDTDYTNNSFNIYYRDVENPTNLFVFTGTNFSELLTTVELGTEITLLEFKTGEKITIKTTIRAISEYGTSGKYYRRQNLIFYFYDANGVQREFLGFGTLENGHGDSIDDVGLGDIYFSVAVDDVTKLGFLMLIANGWSAGTSNPRKVGTQITECTGNSSELKQTFYSLFTGEGIEYDPDPWSNAGYAGIGGGEGTFDFESDVIGLPPIPSVDSVSSGFLQLFSGGLPKIIELSKYMWSTDFFDSIVKLTSNPIEIIMGLYMYPFVVPATSQKYVRAGNVITNISMNVPDSQIFEIDCGVFPVPQFYGAYLDYEPFSKCEIYLPYCGTFNLSMDDISGKEINVRYRVDLLTGLCVAYVIIDNTVKYNFTGSCAVNIPISSRSFENLYNSIIGLVGSMFGGGSFSSPSVGSVSGVVTSGKNQIMHGGIASGNAGYLGVQKPYLIFNVPRVAIPKGLNKYTGYPIFATYKLGDLKGYTEVEEIHLENMGTATKEEIDRIVSLLKGGIIL